MIFISLPHLIQQHENYADRSPWPNDIALLKLSSPVTLGGAVNTACIPQTTDEFTDGDDCWITGWGDSKGNLSSLSTCIMFMFWNLLTS